MIKSRNKLSRVLTIISIISINVLVIILMILWTNYVDDYKQDTSSTVISILKLSISNSDKNDDIDESCSSIINYIDEIPNRTFAIYDDKYNLYNVYSNKQKHVDFNIKNHPVLFNLLNTSNSGHQLVNVDNCKEDVFWSWVTTKDGSRKLLIVYGIELQGINEFSFVFIISYLLIIFILILVASMYIDYRNDYLASLVNLYRLSSCDK